MRSPIRDILASLGGVFAGIDESENPAHFGDWQAEYRAAGESAAIFDCSAMSKVELSGRDRAKFLNNLCTNDIKRLAAGAGCEVFLTNAQGKILFFVRAFIGPESIWLDTVPEVAAALLAHLDKYRITEQVEFTDRSAEFTQLLLVGPRALDCLSAAADAAVPQLADLEHSAIALGGHSSALIRTAALNRPAFELRVPAASAAAVWQELWRAGRPFGLQAMGTKAFEAIRVEAGWPVYGLDLDQSNLPQEVGRTGRAVSFTKGCYLGQETVARIDALGHVNRHLVGLLLTEDADPPPRGANIMSAGKPVGQVTSSAYSPAMSRAIALGYVRRGHEKPGSELVIESQDKPVQAAACALPFSTRS